jgi:hypothetical protein
VELTEAELHAAERLHARVDATPELMLVELVTGPPPAVPVFEAAGYSAPAELELGDARRPPASSSSQEASRPELER